MTTITLPTGEKTSVTVRRTESCDAQKITELMSPYTAAMFGRVNVLYLLEKANLALTIISEKNEFLAHAAFADHPIPSHLVDQASWENFFQIHFNTTKFTPLNTIFLHLYVAQPGFSVPSAKEIIRTVFNTITELEYICLVTPHSSRIVVWRDVQGVFHLHPVLAEIGSSLVANILGFKPALRDIFKAMPYFTKKSSMVPTCATDTTSVQDYMCKARVEDLIDLTYLEQMKSMTDCWPVLDKLAKKIEEEDEMNHVAVFENDCLAVGFIIISGKCNLSQLNMQYQLGAFDGLRKSKADKTTDPLNLSTELQIKRKDPVSERTTQGRGTSLASDAQDNAFLIQIQISKKFETRAVDCLPYVFQLFPERDYCIISVDTLESDSFLLQTFVRAVPRDFTSRDLYLFHRSGLLKMLEVRGAVPEDKSEILELLPQHEALVKDLDQFFNRNPDIHAFVVQVKGQIIGVLVIRNEQDIEYVRANYDIENFVYFRHHQPNEHGRLCQFALNPIFQNYAKHVFKEALRLSHKSCLYYRVYPSYHMDRNISGHSLTSVLSCMVPVRPRRQIIYPLEDLGINAPSDQIIMDQVPYALNHINRKLVMESKVNINAKIVVVGASDTGLAFLEALTCCSHLQFNNLTLIDPHGLPEYFGTDNVTFLATSHCYNKLDHPQVLLCSWVNVVKGKMTAIDRSTARVQVNEDYYIPYDHLILCTGQQYQMLCPVKKDISSWTSTSSLPERPIPRYTGPIPSNLFILNNQQDCTHAYQWLMGNFVKQKGNAVVYGDTIDVYTCVETLLGLGVSGSRIHVVHQMAAGSPSCRQNLTVDQAIKMALEKEGVHVHHNYLLARMNDGQHPVPLTSVSFTTDGPLLRLQCAVFFNFSYKGVDCNSFNAVNNAYLVFDGRLVIDSNYHTNDCKIHAAGPLTKLQRRYYADQWSHTYFNSKEVGQELAAMLLQRFDPTLPPSPKPAPDAELIPIYRQPKITGGKLPGGYHYLYVTKPSGYTNVSPSASTGQGRSIVTGNVEEGNYFRLYFSQQQVVESITCLSFNPLPVSNYPCLYGKHQKLLNQLYARFDEGLINDLYSYFRESWCMAIFHDRFADFQQEVHQIITAELGSDLMSITNLSEISERLADDTLETLEDQPGRSDLLAKVKKSVLDYLQFNQYHLPMYAQPRPVQR